MACALCDGRLTSPIQRHRRGKFGPDAGFVLWRAGKPQRFYNQSAGPTQHCIGKRFVCARTVRHYSELAPRFRATARGLVPGCPVYLIAKDASGLVEENR